jgi:peptidoglycan/LPS O-acetylase OafA/YrhL
MTETYAKHTPIIDSFPSDVAIDTAAREDVAAERLSSKKHFPELDGVRGVAILLVLIFHTFPAADLPLIGKVLAKFTTSMWIGVDLFFVLSGFLITRILIGLKDKPGRMRVFYARRTLRIFPLYYLSLTIFLWVLPYIVMPALKPFQSMWPWFYGYSFNIWVLFNNDWPATNTLDHFWSLAIEEQFYLFWPFLIFYFRRERLPLIAATVCFVALACKTLMFRAGYDYPPVYTMLFSRMDEFALGALASYAYVFGDDRRLKPIARRIFFAALAVVAVLFVVRRGFWPSDRVLIVFGLPVVALMFAAGIFLSLHAPLDSSLKSILASRALRFFGKYSYGIYVYHWVLHQILSGETMPPTETAPTGGHHGLSPMMVFALTNALTIAVAVISYHAFEVHFLKVRPRVGVKSARAATAV